MTTGAVPTMAGGTAPPLASVRRTADEGVTLVFVLLSLTSLTVLGMGLTALGMSATTAAVNERDTAEALTIADAGVAHARRLVLWQEWSSFDPFLQNTAAGADGAACTGDELAGPPALPVSAGYPLAASEFIPGGGRPFGRGRYQVFICDDHDTDFDELVTPRVLDLDPDVDMNKRILIRSIGTGPTGAMAAVELVIGTQPLPALIVNGNLRLSGNPTISGTGGATHANGDTLVAGNPCAEQYYGAVGDILVSGKSAGSGAGCAPANLDIRPSSAPLNVPFLDPSSYKAQATYWLENDGRIVEVATGDELKSLPGWNWNKNNQLWRGNSQIVEGIYWANSNVSITGSPGHPANPLPFSLLATLSVSVAGNPALIPALVISGPGQPPLGVAIIAGTDLDMSGSPSQVREGLFYAGHQLEISGSININGQVIAANIADTPYPPGNTNNVTLDGDERMRITGNPTITNNGTGYASAVPIAWRECRSGVDPSNPCGPLWGGP